MQTTGFYIENVGSEQLVTCSSQDHGVRDRPVIARRDLRQFQTEPRAGMVTLTANTTLHTVSTVKRLISVLSPDATSSQHFGCAVSVQIEETVQVQALLQRYVCIIMLPDVAYGSRRKRQRSSSANRVCDVSSLKARNVRRDHSITSTITLVLMSPRETY